MTSEELQPKTCMGRYDRTLGQLRLFQKLGLQVQTKKTIYIYTHTHIFPSTKQLMRCGGNFLDYAQSNTSGKYLGFPIKHKGNNTQDLSFVLDRMKCKLAGWKANLLFMARRAVLIQASSSAIPTYIMQCNLLPDKVLDGIDRVNRKFL